jgi:outer membrane beta-barrel protein
MFRSFASVLARSRVVWFAFAWNAATPALAQDTVDIGTIKDSDIVVVQRLLYPKDNRSELGVHLGAFAFDPFLFTPNVQLSFDKHFSETLGFSLMVGGGYGLKNGAYRELETPAYGKTPYAFRYLGSVLGGLEYAPIYAKANLDGARVVHFDMYGVARVGATFESSVLPQGGFSPSPTVSLGLGTRVFSGPNMAVRLELRDDVLVQYRKLTDSWHVKQNVNFTLGISRLSAVKASTR